MPALILTPPPKEECDSVVASWDGYQSGCVINNSNHLTCLELNTKRKSS